MIVLKYVLLILFSYLLGNINFALLLSKFNKSDISKKGSGNPGTMNMLRNYGAKLGGMTLVLDVIKGVVPTTIGFFMFGGYANMEFATLGMYIAGFSVIIGHIYPITLKFKGGKGIACSLGVFLVANPLCLIIFFIIAIIYLYFFEYGSISSLIVITALTIIEGIKIAEYNNIAISVLLFAIFFITWFAHRQNIFRLLIGRENRVSLKKAFSKRKVKKQIKNDFK